MNKKNIIKEAGVFLMAALIIITSFTIVADTQPTVSFSSTKKTTAFTNPSRDEVELKYYNEENLDIAIGLTGPAKWKSAIRLTQDELAPYMDWTLTKVVVAYAGEIYEIPDGMDIQIYIYKEGTPTSPGPIIVNDTTAHFDDIGVYTVPLMTPVPLATYQEIWVAIEWTQLYDNVYYAWMDTITGPNIPDKSDWCYLGSWQRLHDVIPSADGRWGIGAIVEGTPQQPPDKPVISGPTTGTMGTLYSYNVISNDPENDDIFYFIDWGDGTYTDWMGPYNSGETVTMNHSWSEKGTYTIRAKAKDDNYGESVWSDPVIMTIKGPMLILGDIAGGIGRVSIDIKNIGGADATNIIWGIKVTGGLLGRTIVNRSKTITSIAPNSSETAVVRPIGFGPVTITVTVRADNVPEIRKKGEGLLLFFMTTITPPTGEWWPMYRYDSGNTGCSPSTAPNTNHLIWKQNIGPIPIYSETPVVVDNRVYVSTSWYYKGDKLQGTPFPLGLLPRNEPRLLEIMEKLGNQKGEDGIGLYCLDADYGNALWNISLDYPTDPAIADGNLYVADLSAFPSYTNSNLYSLNATTGATNWVKNLNGWVFSSVIIAENRIHISVFNISTYQATLNCFDRTGKSLWNYTLPLSEIVLSSAAVGDGKVYYNTFNLSGGYDTGGYLYCLNAETGNFLWSKPTTSYVSFIFTGCPVYSEGHLYLLDYDYQTDNAYLNCYDATTGTILWNQSLGFSFCTPAIDNDSVYALGLNPYSYETYLYRFTSANGTLVWNVSLSNLNYLSSPVIADGKIYLTPSYYYGGQELYCYDKNNGNEIWNYSLDTPSFGIASIAGNRLFTTDLDGNVYCFEDVLKIGSISGGIASVKATIENNGETEFTNVNWTISVQGGLSGTINQTSEGTIPSLLAGSSTVVRSPPIVGVGKIQILVTVTTQGSNIIRSTRDGIVLGPFILITRE